MEVEAYRCQGLVGVGLSQAFMFIVSVALCFVLLLLSFTLFSREREHFCELKLHPIHFMGLWITGQATAWGSFSSTVSCCGSCLTGDFPVFQAHVPSILISFL